jgi:hypothetical protein
VAEMMLPLTNQGTKEEEHNTYMEINQEDSEFKDA